ncbi:MAG: ModD protein [Miniphocaeibacter sp.]|jgi:molybdenum transport protein|uniref:ModD protein n=1 Tax=Miniphocaeibacter sp. TaxID=3100973 RepID=UPI00184BDB67|nr:ModD protein [Gallicola sp.]
MFFKREELEKFIEEDIPYFDLTSFSLGIEEGEARISYFTRENCIVSGSEEVKGIFEILGIEVENFVRSGSEVEEGTELISGLGNVQNVQYAWKVGQNLLDNSCGIATKTRKLVNLLKNNGFNIPILTTRKVFPGTKKQVTKAILMGGAVPHRMGLSETILVFDQHKEFLGGIENFVKKLDMVKLKCCEKKIVVEVKDFEEARILARAGIDGLQFDKVKASELEELIKELRLINPSIIILAAGGINENNILEYARTGANGLVTTAMYHAKPIDIGVKIKEV